MGKELCTRATPSLIHTCLSHFCPLMLLALNSFCLFHISTVLLRICFLRSLRKLFLPTIQLCPSVCAYLHVLFLYALFLSTFKRLTTTGGVWLNRTYGRKRCLRMTGVLTLDTRICGAMISFAASSASEWTLKLIIRRCSICETHDTHQDEWIFD